MQYLASALLLAAGAQAHYHLSNVGVATTPEFVTVRQPTNFQSNGAVENLNGAEMTCNQLGKAQKTLTVSAGSSIPVAYSQNPYHPGPYQVYMAKVPEGQTADSWSPSGNVWFKIFSKGATFGSGDQIFPASWPNPMSVPLPKALPNGDYLVRAEQIGLHIAGKPQLYIGCGQVTVTGGGSGSPGPLVAFPGAYKMTDPGLSVNIAYPKPTSYTPPGPAVWTG